MDKNQLCPNIPLNVCTCFRMRNQLGKAFELNWKEIYNLTSSNNFEECMDTKQMVCKKFGKVEFGSLPSSVHKCPMPKVKGATGVFLILKHTVWHKVDTQ